MINISLNEDVLLDLLNKIYKDKRIKNEKMDFNFKVYRIEISDIDISLDFNHESEFIISVSFYSEDINDNWYKNSKFEFSCNFDDLTTIITIIE